MDRDEWLWRIGSIRRWSRGGERAPHKPLLLLYALGRLQRTGATAVTFSEAEPALARLLDEYGPSGRRTSPAYPFHHLQRDGLWVVFADGAPGASAGQLRNTGAVGQLTAEFETALLADPGLVALIAGSLLDANFPVSLHDEICQVVGIDISALEGAATTLRVARLRRRDPRFRELVLVAYEYRCAMCGYDGRLGNEAVGLDAAHLRWWAFEGPDSIENGLCLCSFHHKLLDRGVLGVRDDHTIAVSAHFVGRGRASQDLVHRLVGETLIDPQCGHAVPGGDHIAWHTDQVFRSPARIPA